MRNGRPNPDTLDGDRERLTAMINATKESWHGRKMSPLYQLVPNLQEPDWRTLRMANLREFWDAHDAWEARIIRARREGRVGDMLVLADEAPVSAFRASAWIRAGKALRRVGHFGFALEQLEKGLAIEPYDIEGLREKGICLERMAQQDRRGYSLDLARSHYRAMLKREPHDAESWSLLGHVEKHAWTASWRLPESSVTQKVEDARYEDALLREAIHCYETAFRSDPRHYYSGVNALTLMSLYEHLTADTRYRGAVDAMIGAARFAAQSEDDSEALYWAKASLGDLQVLTGEAETIEAAYKEAVAINRDNWFALDSSRTQLELLRELGFRPDSVKAGIAVFDRAIRRLSLPRGEWEPRRVFLFSGHMVDSPQRESARFPEEMVPAAGKRIAELMERLQAGPDDIALTQGACGGDLLFTEACQSRGVRIHWLQPFVEPEFIHRSVEQCGEAWRQRYFAVRQLLEEPVRAAPEELGDLPAHATRGYHYERCNRWLLYTALALGVEKVHFVCLWNGTVGDVPGGTADLYEKVSKRTGQVHWIDTRSLLS
jgi:tetratricopeptide (TPR) repeat protein